jgi:hypothetical protein
MLLGTDGQIGLSETELNRADMSNFYVQGYPQQPQQSYQGQYGQGGPGYGGGYQPQAQPQAVYVQQPKKSSAASGGCMACKSSYLFLCRHLANGLSRSRRCMSYISYDVFGGAVLTLFVSQICLCCCADEICDCLL